MRLAPDAEARLSGAPPLRGALSENHQWQISKLILRHTRRAK